MNNYTPLHVHIFSILDSISCVDKFVERAKDIGSTSLALTDHGTLAGAIDFHSECKKQGIKPILGLEAYICEQPSNVRDDSNRSLMHLVLLAKNLEGWYDLIKINNISNRGENFYYNPRAHLDDIIEITKKGNLIGMSACIAGVVATQLFDDYKGAYKEKTEQGVALCLKENCIEAGIKEAKRWSDAFSGNFYLEIQNEGLASQKIVMNCLREISKKAKIPLVATGDAHFPNQDYTVEHEILVCSQTKTNMSARQAKRAAGEDIMFADNSGYYIKSYDEMKEGGFTDEELNATNIIADQIEEFELKAEVPRLPVFPLPEGYKNNEELFIKLCKEGLKRIGKENDQEYKDRANMEFNIFKGVKTDKANLLDYFLIVWDIVEEIKRLGSTTPVGRGSAAGCLCSYLIGVTKVDPIEYNLSFQRFFNTGRLSEGRIAMPDIDLDCASTIRQDLVKYLKEKYGNENVAQIATRGTLAPKAALKEVMRAYDIPFDEANEFTKKFPEKELKQDEDSKYTIQDGLNISPEFKEMAEKYKAQVESAIKLENNVKSRGIHAAAVIISDEPISNITPLVWDTKSKSSICAFEMGAAEEIGLIKFDLLGLKLLSVLDLCQEKINDKKIKPIKLELDDENLHDIRSQEIVLNYFTENNFKQNKAGFYNIFEKDGKKIPVFVKTSNIDDFMSNKMDNDIYQFHQEENDGMVIIVDENNVYTAKSKDLTELSMDKIIRFGVIQNEKLIKCLRNR